MPSEPRTLVFVFLRGGLDGLNAVVPTFEDAYHDLRPTIALERRKPGDTTSSDAIPLDDRFSLHPALEPLLPAYREGRLAIAHAVGSDDDTRSHFEAQDQMEHGASARRPLSGGWLARWLRTLPDVSALSALAFGRTVPESLRGAPTVTAVESLDEIRLATRSERSEAFADALSGLYAQGGESLRQAGADALALLRRIEDIRSEPASATEYPDSGFGRSLSQVARLLRRDVGLRAAAVDQGFYDTHVTQDAFLSAELEELAGGLAAFDADLGDELRERVTLVCLSEFGRRSYENAGLGTDHGRGTCAFVLGSGVHGGRVITDWPGLSDTDTEGPGDLRVTLDYRDLLWEALERRFGATGSDAVFPGLRHERPGIFA
jgi:uncharacterized protein (DUF1501 family)